MPWIRARMKQWWINFLWSGNGVSTSTTFLRGGDNKNVEPDVSVGQESNSGGNGGFYLRRLSASSKFETARTETLAGFAKL